MQISRGEEGLGLALGGLRPAAGTVWTPVCSSHEWEPAVSSAPSMRLPPCQGPGACQEPLSPGSALELDDWASSPSSSPAVLSSFPRNCGRDRQVSKPSIQMSWDVCVLPTRSFSGWKGFGAGVSSVERSGREVLVCPAWVPGPALLLQPGGLEPFLISACLSLLACEIRMLPARGHPLGLS